MLLNIKSCRTRLCKYGQVHSVQKEQNEQWGRSITVI